MGSSSTRNRWTTIGLAATAAGAAMVLCASTAFAAGNTYKVLAGSVKKGTESYTGATANGTASNPAIVFKDVTSNLTLGCNSGGAKGVAKLSKSESGTKLASIKSTTWNTCVGPAGLKLVPSQSQTWNINATGTTSGAGVTAGNVSNVLATVKASPTPSSCEFTVSGAADATYNNSNGALALAPVAGSGNVLKVSKVTGCFGLINNNDIVQFTSSYTVTAPDGALTITSN